MRAEVRWLSSAVASKDIVVEMTHFCFRGGEVLATDGKLAAGTPYACDHEFMVPGAPLRKVLDRMPADPAVKHEGDVVTLRAGRFSGKLDVLPADRWGFPSVGADQWRPVPPGLLDAFAKLRPFVSDNASRPWAICVAIEPDWLYATTNVALAGVPLDTGVENKVLLPNYAVDFVLSRSEGLRQWAVNENYVAFRWSNGAWLRSQLVIGEFPPEAARLVRQAAEEQGLTDISSGFRDAFTRVAGLTEGPIHVGSTGVRGRLNQAEVEDAWEGAPMPLPEEEASTCWTAEYALPVIKAATAWAPERWPGPAPWRGEGVVGYLAARSR